MSGFNVFDANSVNANPAFLLQPRNLLEPNNNMEPRKLIGAFHKTSHPGSTVSVMVFFPTSSGHDYQTEHI